MSYRAPAEDLAFILRHVVPIAPVAATERFAEATPETVQAVLTEAARMCDEVLAPHPALRLEPGDLVCIMALTGDLPEVERLLQVGIDYF